MRHSSTTIHARPGFRWPRSRIRRRRRSEVTKRRRRRPRAASSSTTRRPRAASFSTRSTSIRCSPTRPSATRRSCTTRSCRATCPSRTRTFARGLALTTRASFESSSGSAWVLRGKRWFWIQLGKFKWNMENFFFYLTRKNYVN